jgi:hypothetical protein
MKYFSNKSKMRFAQLKGKKKSVNPRLPSVQQIGYIMENMWKGEQLLRSKHPTPDGDYQYVLPEYAKKVAKKRPETGGFITYQQFQSNLN